jgi:hypothetical protein
MNSDWDVVVEDETAKKEILAILADDASMRILSQNQIPTSPLTLSKQLNVPSEVVERKGSELLSMGLLAIVKSPGSVTGSAYRSLIHQISVRLEPEGISVVLTVNGSVSPKTARSLLSISRPAT